MRYRLSYRLKFLIKEALSSHCVVYLEFFEYFESFLTVRYKKDIMSMDLDSPLDFRRFNLRKSRLSIFLLYTIYSLPEPPALLMRIILYCPTWTI